MTSDRTPHSDLVSIGSAAIDVFVRAPHSIAQCENGHVIQFPLGAKIKVEEAIQTCGGGATNTAVGFARLGMTARFCGITGDDAWGDAIRKTLEKEGVLTDASVIVEGEISSFSIVLLDGGSGARTILYSPSVNAHMGDSVFPRDLLKSSDWMYLNHLSDISTMILDDCLALVTKPSGRKFAWNPGGTQIRQGMAEPMIAALLPHTDLLFLNKEEALAFTRTSSVQEAMRACMHAGVAVLCVSDGERGAQCTDGQSVWSALPPTTGRIVDTTGAGDAFATGVTWGVWKGMSLPESLQAGMINAASVLGFIGTKQGLLSHTDIIASMEASPIRVHQEPLP